MTAVAFNASSAAKSAVRCFLKATRLVLRSRRSMIEARMRRIQCELQFRDSFNAYREGKGIPPLGDDLRSGS